MVAISGLWGKGMVGINERAMCQITLKKARTFHFEKRFSGPY